MKRKGVKLIMSEYADIVIGNLSLHWFRNYLDSKIVSLFFSKNDLIVVNNCNIDDDDKDADAARDVDVARVADMLKQGAVGGTGRQRRAHAAYDGFFKQAFPAFHAGING